MYNHTGLQGRLTADPELRYTQQGTAITSFTLASDTGRKTKDGKKITNFIECVAWRAQAEFVCKYLSKGRLVLVEGELTSRSYEDKDGNRRKAVEITVDSVHFCDSKKDGCQSSAATSPIRATLRAPATSRRSRTMATFHFNLTAGRPADDQKQATNKRPQKGGDDRGMAASASDTQGSPQTVRRC